ncbi:hypothetical protein [Hoeflea sp.]|uniref:hypothetical protein n=1 Tax=Hoeflea sp. TaxID=1940281 RepID=UPI003748AD7B
MKMVVFCFDLAAILKIKCQKIKQKLEWLNCGHVVDYLGAMSSGLIRMRAEYSGNALAQSPVVHDYWPINCVSGHELPLSDAIF